jgi:uncharacterized protein
MVTEYEWDERKNAANFDKHRVRFEQVRSFIWSEATENEDADEDYGEARVKATSFIGDGLYVLVYTARSGVIRVISLRKATNTEKREYVEEISGR